MKVINRLVSSLFIFSFLLTTFVTKIYAACDEATEVSTEVGCIPNTVPGFVGQFYGIFFGLIGGVGVLYVIVGGYFILTSQGDPIRLSTGRSYITYAVIGLLLAIFGYIVTRVVAVDILRIPGFN